MKILISTPVFAGAAQVEIRTPSLMGVPSPYNSRWVLPILRPLLSNETEDADAPHRSGSNEGNNSAVRIKASARTFHGSCIHPQFRHHRPYRSWEEHARRSPAGAYRLADGARNASAGARCDGPGA